MMICPVCTIELVVIEKQNIEIDYYPQCRGVWLDWGELEKLIECSSRSAYCDHNDRGREGYRDEHRDRSYDREHSENRSRNEHGKDREYRGGHHGDKRRRGSFLGDLFDFD